MNSINEFEQQYTEISETELWKILREKVTKEGLTDNFLIGVGEICEHGIIISKDIIRFFSNYTLHDITHIKNVCKWMIDLLGERKEDLSAEEAALLVMAACCHDIGMSVSKAQEKNLRDHPEKRIWQEYFKENYEEAEKYEAAGKITDEIFRNFIRKKHHERIGEHIKADKWPMSLIRQNITRDILIDLCKSHGESLSLVKQPQYAKYNMPFCAVLLRLADILDFDSTRAPELLFEHLGLNTPDNSEQETSQTEWLKNQTGELCKVNEEVIELRACFTSIQIEIEVREYLKWVKKELEKSTVYLSAHGRDWSDFKLPVKISLGNPERIGYKFGDFRLTMDQDRVLELLSGQNLYSDSSVFVRELLQNSIDAILARRDFDTNFKGKGTITIRTWKDNEGYDWFRIEDDGIGMDEDTITNYFLKIGRSYYTSEDYKADRKFYAQGDSHFAPTSRFGIGILSCFMSDPDNNRLEISTKKYSHSPDSSNPAIRLNVDGLHGYYYLADEKEQKEYDVGFKPMHSPDGEEGMGYRSDAGTTICVRTHLFQLGNYSSFQEIVDKYVHCPDVKVEYYGAEGHKIYTDRNTLTNAIDSFITDEDATGKKEITHLLTEEMINEIELNFPIIKWIEKPSITLTYHSLGKLSASDNLSGVTVHSKVNAMAEVEGTLEYNGVLYKPSLSGALFVRGGDTKLEIEFSIVYPSDLDGIIDALERGLNDPKNVMFDLKNNLSDNDEQAWEYLCNKYTTTKNQLKKRYKELQDGSNLIKQYRKNTREYAMRISYDTLTTILSKNEVALLLQVISNISYAKNGNLYYYRNTVISYNGILAGIADLLGVCRKIDPYDCLGTVLLLYGKDYYPEVNIARDSIRSLPLGAILDIERIERALGHGHGDGMFSEKYEFYTEKEYEEFLIENSIWESRITFSGVTVSDLIVQPGETKEVSLIEYCDRPVTVSWFCALAILKKHFTVYNNESKSKNMDYVTHDSVIIGPKKADEKLLDFPVHLFYHFPDNENSILIKNHFGCNIAHRFSQWLIKNQKVIKEKTPGLYYDLIQKMTELNYLYKYTHLASRQEIINYINQFLLQIKEHNIIVVDDDLFINESDIIWQIDN